MDVTVPRGRRLAVTAIVMGLAVLVALAVLAVVRAAPRALTAVGVGVLLALALDPVLTATQRRLRCSRATGTIIVGGGLVGALSTIVLILGPEAASQASDFADELPDTVRQFYSWPVVGRRLEDADAVGRIERFADELPSSFDVDDLAGIAERVLTSAGMALLVTAVAVSVLLDGAAIVERVRRAIPPERRNRADEIGRIAYRSLARYFAGSVSVAVLNGFVIFTAGLLLGVPLAPLAGIWAAITNLIPQIGGLLGGSFFVLLAVSEGPVPGLVALLVFLVYQQLENNVIQPTVIGNAVDLTPPTTMLAALIGGAAAGVPGALVATPLVGAVKSVWMELHGQDTSAPGGEPGSGDGDRDGDGDGGQKTGDGGILHRLVSRLSPG